MGNTLSDLKELRTANNWECDSLKTIQFILFPMISLTEDQSRSGVLLAT